MTARVAADAVPAALADPSRMRQATAADVSAVVFSVNPVSGDRGEIVVNAAWGYGESLVGGTVTRRW